ncbi:MAG: hypothetical protein K1X89_16005 [Myxococcaceae bacterium]|nr:hypothetical protein [Myxococcaceae bacterium]
MAVGVKKAKVDEKAEAPKAPASPASTAAPGAKPAVPGKPGAAAATPAAAGKPAGPGKPAAAPLPPAPPPPSYIPYSNELVRAAPAPRKKDTEDWKTTAPPTQRNEGLESEGAKELAAYSGRKKVFGWE